MNDQILQRKLNQFVRLGMELDQEAKRRFGSNAFLFHEADGSVHIMCDDDCSGDRQRFIKFSADGVALWGSGAW